MNIGGLPLFAALREKMSWHQTRQSVLAQNVANAETPGFRASDLKAFEFSDQMRAAQASSVATVVTDRRHIAVAGSGGSEAMMEQAGSFEVTPDGNSVSLEDEMMKVAANQMDYQAVTTLYQRSMRIMRIAIGRSA